MTRPRRPIDVRPLHAIGWMHDTRLEMHRTEANRDHGSSIVDDLILDLLEWIGPGERPYRETMEAWRTSCPRLPVWEDATDRGLIERHRRPGEPVIVSVSAAGVDHLRRHRAAPRC